MCIYMYLCVCIGTFVQKLSFRTFAYRQKRGFGGAVEGNRGCIVEGGILLQHTNGTIWAFQIGKRNVWFGAISPWCNYTTISLCICTQTAYNTLTQLHVQAFWHCVCVSHSILTHTHMNAFIHSDFLALVPYMSVHPSMQHRLRLV